MAEIDKRIKPSDLKAECMRCGGSGRNIARTKTEYPTLKHVQVEERYVGPCIHCSGSGRVFPRKIDV